MDHDRPAAGWARPRQFMATGFRPAAWAAVPLAAVCLPALRLAALLLTLLGGMAAFGPPPATAQQPPIGERGAIPRHLEQARVNAGEVGFAELFVHGRILFEARFNALDGQGRPATTGAAAPRLPVQPPWNRIATPGTNSCAGCHFQPDVGGAGDFVANAFVGANGTDPVTLSLSPTVSMERNSVALQGSGPIEILAREMTTELIAIREEARAVALERVRQGENPLNVYETRDLVAKGVSFGKIRVRGDGKVNPSRIEGVDWDLVIKPFHQKGDKVSVREFASRAMNIHHGMQSSEKFGLNKDPDRDGVINEMTFGDITSLAIFQAGLGTPGQLVPSDPYVFRAVGRGKALFRKIGCDACHLPALELETRFFHEPNPYNPVAHTAREEGLGGNFRFDMTTEGAYPRLERWGEGAIVRAFTDLKRHNLNDDELQHFANERIPMGPLFGYAKPGDFYNMPASVVRPIPDFLTAKLWFAGNTDPYGHRGDLTMLTEAIHFHGGEARASRDAFFGLTQYQRDCVIEFLKSLQILPPGSPRLLVAEEGQ